MKTEKEIKKRLADLAIESNNIQESIKSYDSFSENLEQTKKLSEIIGSMETLLWVLKND